MANGCLLFLTLQVCVLQRNDIITASTRANCKYQFYNISNLSNLEPKSYIKTTFLLHRYLHLSHVA